MCILTEKHRLFALEYLVDLNATRAYKAIYKNVKKDTSATELGSRLLDRPDIRAFLDQKLKELQDQKIAKVEEVMEYLTSVMRGESKSEIVVVEGIGEGCSSAVHIDKAPDEKEKLKAAELLGKRYGLFTDKVQLESTVPIQIFDDIPKGDVDG